MSSRRAWQRLGILFLLYATTSFCASVDRGRSKLYVSGQGGYGTASHRTAGCAGVTSQTHSQLGGAARVRYVSRGGPEIEGTVSAVRGTLEESTGIEPVARRSPYWLGGLGLNFGWSWKYYGISVGGQVVDRLDLPRGNLVSLFIEHRIGRQDAAWLELAGGSGGALYDGRLMRIGFACDVEGFRGGLGVAAFSRPLLRQNGPIRVIAGSASANAADWGAYADLELDLPAGFFASLNADASQDTTLRFGLGYTFVP